MSAYQPASRARFLVAGPSIVVLGILVALATVAAATLVKPVILGSAVVGLIILIPTLVLRDPKPYWLFLLIVSIPIDFGKQLTKSLVDPSSLSIKYGPPGSEITSIDIYVSDAVLFVMVIFWLARLAQRREQFYFPKLGYIYIIYLAWGLIISLINAVSYYLAIFEWCRDILYLLFFVYLVNNVVTRAQLRAAVLALLAGLVVASVSIIGFFDLNVKTNSVVYSRSDAATTEPLTPHETSTDSQWGIKRSAGIFSHGAVAAYYLEFTLFVALALMMTASRLRDQLLFGALFFAGCIALYLTFSRSGLVGFAAGSAVFFAIGRWSRLLSRLQFRLVVLGFVMVAAASAPLLLISYESRTKSLYRRVEFLQIVIDLYREQPLLPLLGAGMNNSSPAVKKSTENLTDKGHHATAQSIHTHYLVVLTEVGLIGFLLFFGFFGRIAVLAVRSMKHLEKEDKVLVAAMVGSLASIALHNLGDGFGGHSINAMLWLYAGLMVAITRRVRPAQALRASARGVGSARLSAIAASAVPVEPGRLSERPAE
jgi:hypothetical protein